MVLYKKKIISNYVSQILCVKNLYFLDFLIKLNIYNFFLLFNINKVITTITISKGLRNEVDLKIINALELLDFLFNKKTEINNLTNLYVKRAKTIIFVARTTIQYWVDIYLLLFLLKKVIEPTLNKKFIYFMFKVNKCGFSLYINDISSIDLLPDFLKKECIGLKISFFFKQTYNIDFIKLFLKYFGF